MTKELNKEITYELENLDGLIEELLEREEFACKGKVSGIDICVIN